MKDNLIIITAVVLGLAAIWYAMEVAAIAFPVVK